MFRVANALTRYRPADVEIVEREADADLLVLHVIGLEAVDYRPHQRCAVIQYCLNTTQPGDSEPWHPLWERAALVWSYYDLHRRTCFPFGRNFYHAPIGIDPVFRAPAREERLRDITILTSGYVNGRGQEAIQEPHVACQLVPGATAMHLGPIPEGLTRPFKFNYRYDLGDSEVAALYHRCKWVAGLRFVEGFELGVVEGLACGARPIVFDRPDNRYWFEGHAVFVPENYDDRGFDSEELTYRLADIIGRDPAPVTAEERREVLARFHWPTILDGFWRAVKEGL